MIRFFFYLFLMSSMCVTVACSTDGNNNTNNSEKGSTKDASANPEQPAGGCQFSSDCECSETCTGGACKTIECTASADCRCGWKCVKGACYDPKNAPCEKDDDCTADPKLWKCDTENGKCIDGGCRKDGDCKDPKKPECNLTNNQCQKKKCTSNNDCLDATKPVCDTASGDCGPDKGVDVGGDCSGTKKCKLKLFCYRDNNVEACRKACTNFGSSDGCPKDTVCIRVTGVTNTQGLCLEPGEGVDEGGDCSEGKKCKRYLSCAYTGKGETCQRPCQDDSSCENEETCQPYGEQASRTKLCLPKPSPCGPGRACPGEDDGYHICSNGQCQVLLCPKQRSCPVTQKCTASGRCVPINCPTEKCPDLYECKNNRCSETNEGKSCGQGTNIKIDGCGSGLICAQVGYVSSCVRPCATGQCPTGMKCETNRENKKICMQVCPAPKPCKYKAYACVTLKKSPAGNWCVPAGQPTGGDEYDRCSTSSPCLPDLVCFRGFSAGTGYCTRKCSNDSGCKGTKYTSFCYSYGGSQRSCLASCTTSSSSSCPVRHSGLRNFCTYAGIVSGQRRYFCRPY